MGSLPDFVVEIALLVADDFGVWTITVVVVVPFRASASEEAFVVETVLDAGAARRTRGAAPVTVTVDAG